MRIPYPIAALVAFCLAAPAYADVTIRYVQAGGQSLIIEADEQGRIRAEGPAGPLLIIRDGTTYVMPPVEGERMVVRLEDYVAIVAGPLRERTAGLINPSSHTQFVLRERGSETVGRWQGTLYSIEPVGPHEAHENVELVVSSDPALAPVGRAAEPVFAVIVSMFNLVAGEDPPEFIRHYRSVREGRTLLRNGDVYRLESVSTGAVPTSRFDLPRPVLSRDQLRSHLPQ